MQQTVSFLAYGLSITLCQRLKALAGGLMPRLAFEKLSTAQLLDVRVPTTDGRELLLVRRTELDRDVQLLLARLNLTLPPQSPPRISRPRPTEIPFDVVATFGPHFSPALPAVEFLVTFADVWLLIPSAISSTRSTARAN